MTVSMDRVRGVEWAVATRSLPGETESGDLHLVAPFPGGVLLAAVDGLGHGPEAAAVARLAVATLEAHAGEPLARLLLRCHEALRGSRGAVMTVAMFREADRLLTWQGVGNVEGRVLWRGPDGRTMRRDLVTHRGVVGGDFKPPRPGTHQLGPATLLILTTDGIERAFPEDLPTGERVQRLADTVLSRHARQTDDALVLVARFLGADR